MFLATYQTRHFEFSVLAETEKEARKRCEAGWEMHKVQYSHEDVPWADFLKDEVCVTKMVVGIPMRDRDSIRGVCPTCLKAFEPTHEANPFGADTVEFCSQECGGSAENELRRVTVYERPEYDYTDAELRDQGDEDNQEEMEEGEL
mgnify:CR=1 FL=1